MDQWWNLLGFSYRSVYWNIKFSKKIISSHYLLTKYTPKIDPLTLGQKNTTTLTSTTTTTSASNKMAAIVDVVIRINNVTTSMMDMIERKKSDKKMENIDIKIAAKTYRTEKDEYAAAWIEEAYHYYLNLITDKHKLKGRPLKVNIMIIDSYDNAVYVSTDTGDTSIVSYYHIAIRLFILLFWKGNNNSN